MTVYAVLNSASLEAGSDSIDDSVLLEKLAQSLLALQKTVAAYHQERFLVCVPLTIALLELPTGTRLIKALRILEGRSFEWAKRLRSILDRAKQFDEQGTSYCAEPVRDDEVTYNGVKIPALRAAWALRGLCWSADRSGWQIPELRVEVCDATGQSRSERLTNLWSPMLDNIHRTALRMHLVVLPIYEDPGHHEPQRPQNYKSAKSQIPKNAERILSHAVADESGATWWSRCEHGFYHRFQGSERNGWLVVHWNGTTNPNATRNRDSASRTLESHVPPEVRDRLEQFERVSDCGCREV